MLTMQPALILRAAVVLQCTSASCPSGSRRPCRRTPRDRARRRGGSRPPQFTRMSSRGRLSINAPIAAPLRTSSATASRQRKSGRAACAFRLGGRRTGHGDDGAAAGQRIRDRRADAARAPADEGHTCRRTGRRWNVVSLMPTSSHRLRAARARRRRAAAARRRRSRSSRAPPRRSHSAPRSNGASPACERAANAPSKQSPAPVASTLATRWPAIARRGGHRRRRTPSRAALQHDDRARPARWHQSRIASGCVVSRTAARASSRLGRNQSHCAIVARSTARARGSGHSFSRRFGS